MGTNHVVLVIDMLSGGTSCARDRLKMISHLRWGKDDANRYINHFIIRKYVTKRGATTFVKMSVGLYSNGILSVAAQVETAGTPLLRHISCMDVGQSRC